MTESAAYVRVIEETSAWVGRGLMMFLKLDHGVILRMFGIDRIGTSRTMRAH